MSGTTTHRPILVRYEVTSRDDWELPEEHVPESQPHDLRSELIRDLLVHWVERTGIDARSRATSPYGGIASTPAWASIPTCA